MRILLIVQPYRFDFYNYLSQDSENDYLLLWYESRKKHHDWEYPLNFREEYYWRDYRTPKQLIDKIKPDKIVFFEIIDLCQIALIVACKKLKVPTLFLEHGAAGNPSDAITRWNQINSNTPKVARIWRRLSSGIPNIIASKTFYFSVTKGFTSRVSYWKYFLLPFKFLRYATEKVMAETIFPERVPDVCINFSPNNYDTFKLYTGATNSQAHFTGVPFFDKYFSPAFTERDHVIFIDHPNLEEQLFNWTPDFHHSIALYLFQFAQARAVKIYVKLHPKSNKALWLSYGFDKKFLEVLQFEDSFQLFSESKLILGYSSSLITAFLCAHKNVVILGWHPEPRIQGQDFAETGLCHLSLVPEDLDDKYNFWCSENLSFNAEKYQDFINYNNPHFDGKATERVISLISADSL